MEKEEIPDYQQSFCKWCEEDNLLGVSTLSSGIAGPQSTFNKTSGSLHTVDSCGD